MWFRTRCGLCDFLAHRYEDHKARVRKVHTRDCCSGGRAKRNWREDGRWCVIVEHLSVYGVNPLVRQRLAPSNHELVTESSGVTRPKACAQTERETYFTSHFLWLQTTLAHNV
jgi:hypothetical protein